MREVRSVRTEVKEEEVKRGPGQPKSNIDWKKVDELLIAGCTAPEIAGYFGCSVRTLYTRCETDNHVLYSEYSQEKCSKGDSILRAHQFAKALGLTDKGDNTLLIWLGKTRLKQKEQEEQAVSKNIEDKFDSLMDVMKKGQDLSAAESKINADIKS